MVRARKQAGQGKAFWDVDQCYEARQEARISSSATRKITKQECLHGLGQEPTQEQLQRLIEAKEKGLIQNLFDSAGDGVLKVIDKLGFAIPWYDWVGLQTN